MKKLVHLLAVMALVATFSQSLFAADTSSAASSDNAAATAPASTDANANAASSTSSTANNSAKTKVMSMSSLLQQVQKAGYTVKSADLDKDNGVYKVEVLDKFGEKQSLDVNAATGLSTDQKKTPHVTPISQIVKKLEKNGATVKSIAMDSNGYKATVVDKQGNEQDVTTDLLGKTSQS